MERRKHVSKRKSTKRWCWNETDGHILAITDTQNNIDIIQIYAPTDYKAGSEIDEFYNTLDMLRKYTLPLQIIWEYIEELFWQWKNTKD